MNFFFEKMVYKKKSDCQVYIPNSFKLPFEIKNIYGVDMELKKNSIIFGR